MGFERIWLPIAMALFVGFVFLLFRALWRIGSKK